MWVFRMIFFPDMENLFLEKALIMSILHINNNVQQVACKHIIKGKSVGYYLQILL